jgi:hypothetical protein
MRARARRQFINCALMARPLLRSCARAQLVAECHLAGVMHRDIKARTRARSSFCNLRVHACSRIRL